MADSPLERAKAVALRYLASAARTEAQVRGRLARAELAAEADAVVGWLGGLGYLDDAAYAAARARSLLHAGRAGPRLAERRLEAAGIPVASARGAVAAAVVETAGRGGGEGEAALCRALAERRAGTGDLERLEEKERARLARWLLGRGFSGAAVSRVLGVYEDR